MLRDGNEMYQGDHFVMYKNIKALCYTPETTIILYLNYNSIKRSDV